WKRSQQAAFLIRCWQAVQHAAKNSKAEWAEILSKGREKENRAFDGEFSLLATDQGFRSISFCYNAVCQAAFESIDLPSWFSKADSEPNIPSVAQCLKELERKDTITSFLDSIAKTLVEELDWRTSAAPGLKEAQRAVQGQYRGSSGYSLLNKAAIGVLAKSRNRAVQEAATTVVELLK